MSTYCRSAIAENLKGEVGHLLPQAPAQKNGKRVACIGAGPASLTVANDLMPLGYAVTVYEKETKPGGLMRTNIPSFRLPEEVLDDEIRRRIAGHQSIAGLVPDAVAQHIEQHGLYGSESPDTASRAHREAETADRLHGQS